MRSRVTGFVIAALVGTPLGAAALAPGRDAQQSTSDPRVRVPSRVVIQQEREAARQRERERLARSRSGHEESEKTSRTIRIGGNGEVIVSNLSGDITVTRGSGNDLQIEAVKTARGRDARDAREMLDLVRLDIIERGNRVEIKPVYPSTRELPGQHRRNLNVSIAYNIVAPPGTRISARSLSGDITVSDIHGEISAVSTSGDVKISNAERISKATSTSGDVEIVNSSSEIALDVQSVSGDVRLRQVKAPRINAGAVSGTILLTDVQSSRIDAQSLSGDVEFASPLAQRGRYDIGSHSGTIRLAIVGDTGFELDANSFSGSIRVDPSLRLRTVGNGFDSRRHQRSLRGVHGDGSALIDVTTFSGSVVVTKR